MIFDIIQLIGGVILTIGYIPQIKQILKTKSVTDLNFQTFLLIFLGILCMEIYAINLVVNNSGHMFLVTNTMALILSGFVCFLILKYREGDKNKSFSWL